MAESTEAGCLLHSGALYPLRRGYLPSAGDPIFIGVKPGAFSIYFGDAPIYHFDLDGRWQRAFINGLHFLKGLDTTIQALDRVREGESLTLHRRYLRHAEAAELDESIRSMAIDLSQRIRTSLAAIDPPDAAQTLVDLRVHDLLARVTAWDSAAWAAHGRRYRQIYGELSFIPPETSSPVILQGELGEAKVGFGGSNSLKFGDHSSARFADHARDVAALLGRRVLQCRQIFLAGEDAMRRPAETILSDLQVAASVFPIAETRSRPRARDVDPLSDTGRLDGFHAFIHEFDSPPFSTEVWQELRQRRFERLILGVESGSAKVRGLYGRTWDNEALEAWVSSCPVGLGLVVLVGAGGIKCVQEHVDETSRLVSTLKLPPGTLVSLVDAVELGTRSNEERGFEPLDRDTLARQRTELKSRLATELAPRKVKVATYSTEKRWQ